MRRLGVALAVLCLTAAPAAGAQVTATVNRTTVQTGDQVILTVQGDGVEGSMGTPKLPPLGDDVEAFSAGSSRNFSIINGRTSSSQSHRFVLVFRKEGTFTIGPIEVEAGHQTYRTQPIRITVTSAPPPPSPPPVSEGETGSSAGTEEIFARATVDPPNPYLYQQVTLRIRLYTRVALLDNPNYDAPTTQGFWREDLPAPQPSLEVLNGKRYQVLELDMALFPTIPGKLTVGRVGLDCTVRSANQSRDPFSMFGGSLLDGKQVSLRTDPVAVQVRPLPAGAPPGFHGAVGEYTLRATVDHTDASQQSPVNLTLELSGEGHLRTVGDLDLPDLPQFRTYPSQAEQKTTRDGERIGGTLTKQFVLVPLAAGDLTIPPVKLVVFSPKAGAYQTLQTNPIQIHAQAAGGGAPAAGGGGRSDIEVVGHDIRFIETQVPAFVAVGSTWGRTRTTLFFIPVLFLGYGAFWLWERRQRRLGSDTALRRRLGARRTARRILKQGENGNPEEAAARAAEAVRTYVADLFDLPRAGLTPEHIGRALRERDVDPEPVIGFLDRADAVRFAPSASAAGDWLDEARATIEAVGGKR